MKKIKDVEYIVMYRFPAPVDMVTGRMTTNGRDWVIFKGRAEKVIVDRERAQFLKNIPTKKNKKKHG